jgi:hypothetical protein
MSAFDDKTGWQRIFGTPYVLAAVGFSVGALSIEAEQLDAAEAWAGEFRSIKATETTFLRCLFFECWFSECTFSRCAFHNTIISGFIRGQVSFIDCDLRSSVLDLRAESDLSDLLLHNCVISSPVDLSPSVYACSTIKGLSIDEVEDNRSTRAENQHHLMMHHISALERLLLSSRDTTLEAEQAVERLRNYVRSRSGKDTWGQE